MDQNQRVTPDDVERQITDALQRRDREAAKARREWRWEVEKFNGALVGYVLGAVSWFCACIVLCALLLMVVTGGEPGDGAKAVLAIAPFVLWLAGATLYARKAFGPKREDAA